MAKMKTITKVKLTEEYDENAKFNLADEISPVLRWWSVSLKYVIGQ